MDGLFALAPQHVLLGLVDTAASPAQQAAVGARGAAQGHHQPHVHYESSLAVSDHTQPRHHDEDGSEGSDDAVDPLTRSDELLVQQQQDDDVVPPLVSPAVSSFPPALAAQLRLHQLHQQPTNSDVNDSVSLPLSAADLGVVPSSSSASSSGTSSPTALLSPQPVMLPSTALLVRRTMSQAENGRGAGHCRNKSTAEDLQNLTDEDLIEDDLDFDVNPDPSDIVTEPIDKDDVPLLHLPPLPSLPAGVRGIEKASVWINGSFRAARILMHKSLRMQWPGYLLLLVALLGVSSMGVATLRMEGVPPVLKGSWRAQCAALYMLPFFVYQALRLRPSQIRGFMDRSLLINFIIVTMGGVAWSVTFFAALQYTSLAHAYLFSNITCILIVLYKMIRRLPCARLEGIGAIVGVIGGVITVLGQDALDPDLEPPPLSQIVLGDFIAFLGSIGGAFYLMFGSNLRAKVPIFIYMLPLTLCNSAIFIMLSMVLEGTSFSRDAMMGAFGWMTQEWIGAASYLGIVTGLLGFVSYVAVLKFVPAIVVSVVMLLEPVIAVFFAVIVGVIAFPDTLTVVGGLVLLGGTLMVTWATKDQMKAPPPPVIAPTSEQLELVEVSPLPAAVSLVRENGDRMSSTDGGDGVAIAGSTSCAVLVGSSMAPSTAVVMGSVEEQPGQDTKKTM